MVQSYQEEKDEIAHSSYLTDKLFDVCVDCACRADAYGIANRRKRWSDHRRQGENGRKKESIEKGSSRESTREKNEEIISEKENGL